MKINRSPSQSRYHALTAVGAWSLSAVAVVLAGCSLPMEQLSLPKPIGGGGVSGALANPKGTPLGDPATNPGAESQIFPGSGQFVQSANASASNAATSARVPSGQTAGAAGPDGVTLDLVGASIPEAARTVLGELLGVPFTVSDQVKGNITLQTMKPMSKSALLEVFEKMLASNDAAIVVDAGIYRIVSRSEAIAAGRPPSEKEDRVPRGPGIGSEIIPLKYVSAGEMERILKSVVPKGSVTRADNARNLLIVSGTRAELQSMSETVRTFDVDWMRGMSFGIFSIETSDVEAIAQELDTIFANDQESPTKGVVRFIPNARLKAILVITSRQEYIRKAESWIRRIDQAAEATERRAYVYQVQYRPAQELVAILQRVYSLRGQGRTATLADSRRIETGTVAADAAVAGEATFADVGAQGAASQRGALPIRQGGGIAPPLDASENVVTRPDGSESGLASGEPLDVSGGGDATISAGAPSADQAQSGGGLAERVPDDRRSGISFVADEGNNSIVISATPSEWRRIRQVLTEVDVMPSQVLIEATIAEVTLNDDLKFGLRWFFEKGSNEFRLTDTLATGALGAIAPQFPGFAYFLNTANAKVALNALADITNVNVVSSPSLMVLNNKKAVLQIGDQVPIATQQAVATDAALAPIVNAISFRETGVLLTIIPRVANDGRILLDIEQEVSDAKATTTSEINSPTIAQRRIKTTVTVNNGGSVVLAGLMQDRATRQRQQIPLVGDIPLMGNLFKNKDDEIARTELMIAITPHIVNDDRQSSMIAAEFRDRLNFNTRPQRETLPDHKEQFDRIAR